MDSLFATYASSDEEDDHHQHHHQPPPQPPTTTTQSNPPSLSSKASSLFSSLPKPQSSSSSLPPPKSSSKPPQLHKQEPEEQDLEPLPKASALFSALPPPKSQPISDTPLPTPNPKRVVQFRPPVPQFSSQFDTKSDDEEEEDEEEKERKKKRQLGHDTSVKSFLSRMPAPKSSGGSALGAMPNSSGSGRRSIVETEGAAAESVSVPVPVPVSVPVPSSSASNGVNYEVGLESNVENGQGNWVDGSHSYNYAAEGVAGEQSYAGYEGYGGYGGSAGYDSYGSYGQYGSAWSDTSSGAAKAPETSETVESFISKGGKRRKDQPPPEILEVKQDELMKNRPKEDKSKLTGMAFGPSYQPASSKGKPSKLHKRKHQIGALFFDLKQREMELAERRSKGLLTKAETQAKYGW